MILRTVAVQAWTKEGDMVCGGFMWSFWWTKG